jgi:hypothetical protein
MFAAVSSASPDSSDACAGAAHARMRRQSNRRVALADTGLSCLCVGSITDERFGC